MSVYLTDADFHNYVLDEMGDGAASNGFYGVVFAMEMCQQVTLYGYYKVCCRLHLNSACESSISLLFIHPRHLRAACLRLLRTGAPRWMPWVSLWPKLTQGQG